MTDSVDRLRAILAAYKQVVDASAPTLHPPMRDASRRWATATEQQLEAELAEYLREASKPACQIRVFWKMKPQLEFGGCNRQFAQDAGFAKAADLVGLTDFDDRVPWKPQGAKYRRDDEAVMEQKLARLNIIERQKSPTGDITWVRVGKVPVQLNDGTAIGVLGMYEVLDAATGRRLFGEQLQTPGSK